ncbi:Pycsar system effector family protein [Rhizobium leguminosarum]|uniref:Pycsar system effector family protein n=1 Tax=Rhizobium leguminosarum TaxID=384 RepID=UPI003F9B03F7
MNVDQTRLEVLTGIYSNVLTWLHFGEAKNAALSTLTSAAIIGIATVYSQLNTVPYWIAIWMLVVTGQFFLALVIGVLSFMPRVTLFSHSGAGRITFGDNVWFFGHIGHMGVDTFLSKLWEKAEFEGVPTKFERDLGQQIVVNSKIASRKYEMFRVSLWIALSGIITPVLAIILYWLFIDEAV